VEQVAQDAEYLRGGVSACVVLLLRPSHLERESRGSSYVPGAHLAGSRHSLAAALAEEYRLKQQREDKGMKRRGRFRRKSKIEESHKAKCIDATGWTARRDGE
jgi:hypothetical protein